jgi:hypothetical protein
VWTGRPSRRISLAPGLSRVDDSLPPNPHAGRPVRGVALLDRVEARFGWSDRELARALGVTPATISRYRRSGVPDHQATASTGCPGNPSKRRPSPFSGGALTYTRISRLPAQMDSGVECESYALSVSICSADRPSLDRRVASADEVFGVTRCSVVWWSRFDKGPGLSHRAMLIVRFKRRSMFRRET